MESCTLLHDTQFDMDQVIGLRFDKDTGVSLQKMRVTFEKLANIWQAIDKQLTEMIIYLLLSNS